MINEADSPVNINTMRMPLAEWLYRMHEADLVPQARLLAVYAAVFKISNNDELMTLAGMSESAYLANKRKLLAGGWLIISRRKGGRGIGIEVSPAYRETPVNFTDVSPRNPGRFNPGFQDRETPVKKTPVSEKTPVFSTPVSEPSRAQNDSARSDSNNKININNSNNYARTTEAASARESVGSDALVTVNGVAIHGPDFSLDFAAIDMAAALIGADKQRARQIAEMCARDWAVNPSSKPRTPMAQVKAAIIADFRRGQADAPKLSDHEARRERMKQHGKDVEERLNQRRRSK